MEKWTRAKNYMGEDFNDYYIVITRTRDSRLLENHNFEEVMRRLDVKEYGEAKSPIVVRSGHWAVGWIEEILVHQDDKETLKKAEEVIEELRNYGILNEDGYYEREYEAAMEYWESLTLEDKIEMCKEHGLSIFAARRFPMELYELICDL